MWFSQATASTLRIVGHALGGSEVLEREKFDVSSKADPKDGAQGETTKLTEKQSIVMFQVIPVQDGDYENRKVPDAKKAQPLNLRRNNGAADNPSDKEARSDAVDDASKAVQKAIGSAVAEFLPTAMNT
ncbi:uncharacterized protein LOC144139943 [Haemaphysalis longicornis]